MKKTFKPLYCCLALTAMLLLSCAPAAPERAAAAPVKAAPKAPQEQAAQPAHPVDGAWQPDLAATNKISRLPGNAPADLANLTMTLEAKTGKMLLSWADGSSESKTFKFLSQEGRVFRCSVSGVKDHSYLMDVSQPGKLILKDEQHTLVFKRKDAKP